MFDILVYLFENYAGPGVFPEMSVLTRKLTAVGFEEEEVSAALEWLAGLGETAACAGETNPPATSRSLRVYTGGELAHLPVECRSFLLYLEELGAIDVARREEIIEGALALEDDDVSLAQLKIIALMVLWRQHSSIESLDALLLEELLSANDEPATLH